MQVLSRQAGQAGFVLERRSDLVWFDRLSTDWLMCIDVLAFLASQRSEAPNMSYNNVCLSVRHPRESRLNGLVYRNVFFATRMNCVCSFLGANFASLI